MTDRIEHFEEYLKTEMGEGKIDFAFRARLCDGVVVFYVHPASASGRTMDFSVRGNTLFNLQCPPKAKE